MRAARAMDRVRGTALCEWIMAMFISGLLFSVLPGFYFGYIKVWGRETSRLAGVERADLVLQRMQEEIRNARTATVSSDGTALGIVLPNRHYDAAVGRPVNDIDASGQLVDGDQVHYYFLADPGGTGADSGGFFRRVQRADGCWLSPRLITDEIHPELNPLAPGGSSPRPIFAYDPTLRTVTTTVSAAEAKPSAGSFAPTAQQPRCSRDGGTLIRVATASHPEGEIRCSRCGTQVRPNVEMVTYQAQILLRNK